MLKLKIKLIKLMSFLSKSKIMLGIVVGTYLFPPLKYDISTIPVYYILRKFESSAVVSANSI